MNLLSQMIGTITEEKLLEPGNTIVVAVSGGPDSMALLHALHFYADEYGWKLIVAHIHHGFRGKESDEEAAFVEETVKGLGLPIETAFLDVPAYIKETSMNPQAAARELRYRYLHEVAEKYNADAIALAHHADDQAETVLMRIIRGTGPSGLSGIQTLRYEGKMKLVRPLLRSNKSEIIAYLEDNGFSYREDSSNAQRKYFRNRVRLDLIPLLQQYNGNFSESLVRLSDMMNAENDYMDAEVGKLFEREVSVQSGKTSFSGTWFTGLHVALQRRLIKLILSYLFPESDSFDYHRAEIVRSAIVQTRTSNLTLDLSQHVRFTKAYDYISFHTNKVPPSSYEYGVVEGEGALVIPEIGMRMVFYATSVGENRDKGVDSTIEASFDRDRLKYPLRVRSRKPGDRIRGLNGSKKVKDIFIDHKIPPDERETIPLLVDAADEILWIPGVKRSKYATLTDETSACLNVRLVAIEENS